MNHEITPSSRAAAKRELGQDQLDRQDIPSHPVDPVNPVKKTREGRVAVRKHTEGDGTVSRRRFLGGSAVAAGCVIVPASVLGAKKKKAKGGETAKPLPPSERLNIALVGLGARGAGNAQKCDGANIVALCDVDWKLAATAFERYPDVPRYRDYRRMLDKEKGIDAVVVSTPDHTHAVISAEAMKRGKHVYCETPLAHDVWEVRELARIAKEKGVVTQMGNERHSGPGIRRAVEMLWGGGLGPIEEAHCWTNRPQWPQGIGRPTGRPHAQPGLEWDLWLGPAPARVYHPSYHPYRWRGWSDFGTGALGAMGCHLMDVICWGLKLGEAKSVSVEAESTGINGETFAKASTVRYRFAARGDLPPVTVTWYDGGRQPESPEHLPYLRELGSNGSLFIGKEHSMMFGPTVFGTNPGQIGPRTIPEFAKIQATRKYAKIPSVRDTPWQKGSRHIQEWITACRTGKQPCANFAESAPLAEIALLGNVALLAGKPIEWDTEKMQVTNVPEANHFVRREARKGWSL
jgi:predicted dehydrogenase